MKCGTCLDYDDVGGETEKVVTMNALADRVQFKTISLKL